LLHPGANTTQIIDVYISLAKMFWIVDPHYALLDLAACHVRAYLKNRTDTVRCIITNLTDELDGDLHEELHSTNVPLLETSIKGATERHRESRVVHEFALLPMLVSIYRSTEVFVNEYRRILAEKYVSPCT